ncbi:MAG: tetratricopeptide repeat protein, partial [Verrucomicrobiia bacterium]
MKAKLLRWTLLFVLMLPIIPLFGQAQETNHVADKFDPVQSGAVPVDEVRAQFEATKAKAETGDAQAQYNLGHYFANGQGVAQDYAEAVKWYRKAAEQGNADGQFELGRCYANGQGAARDKVEAVKWFRKAAEQGFAQAQCELAMQLGFLGDQNEGIKWLREAAQNGVAEAQCELGMAYLGYAAFFDKVVPKDAVEAVQWLGKAAEQGDAQAQGNLGDCYFRGQGTIRDYIQAYKWVNLAAAQGYTGEDLPLSRVEQLMTPDQIAEGKRLSAEFTPGKEMPGQSKEPPGSTSEFEATKAKAETGDAQAQYNLGVCYDRGRGVARDHAEAVKWYQEAANQGYAEAQNALGLCYGHPPFEGLFPPRAFVKAVEWYREAANQGYAEAQYNLGRCYFLGQGVTQDYVQAYKWFNLAAAQGKTDANMFLNASAVHLSPEAIAEAEKLSGEFVPRKQGEREMPNCHRSNQNQPRKVELNQPPAFHRRNKHFRSKKLHSRALQGDF